MNFELKNVKFYERLSEETNAFTADLFINGKKVAYVKNDGQGGCTDYNVHDFKDHQLLKDAEAYCKALPKAKSEEFDFEYDQTLESVIDDLFEKWLTEKEDKKWQKKFETNMKKGILIGKDKSSYQILSWKGKTLDEILKSNHPSYILALKKAIADCKAKGSNILNTNIPQEYLN